MTFDELQLIVQAGVISQTEMQATQKEIQSTMKETQQIVRSIARGVQAMQEKALTDELKREEEKAIAIQQTLEHQQRMERLENISAGLIRLYGSLDEDRPTVFRALNTIDRKIDHILDRLPPNN